MPILVRFLMSCYRFLDDLDSGGDVYTYYAVLLQILKYLIIKTSLNFIRCFVLVLLVNLKLNNKKKNYKNLYMNIYSLRVIIVGQ